MACDPNFDDVVLLAHFDAPSTFVDSSSFNQTISAIGNGAAGTPAKFGATALQFTNDGSTNGVNVADAASLDFGGNQDFTIEFEYYYLAASPGTPILIQKYNFTSLYPFLIESPSAGVISANGGRAGDGATVYTLVSANVLNTDAYNYIVLQRSGNTFSLYINGTLVDSSTSSDALANNAADVFIGATSGGNGLIDEVRFSNIARYSGSTIPVPTEAFGVACPTQFAYPDFGVGTTTYEEAEAIIAASVFGPLNPPVLQPNASVAVGLIFLQNPAANSLQNAGTVGTVTVSSGAPSDDVVVPQIGLTPHAQPPLTPAQANAALIAAGLTQGVVSVSTDPNGVPGTVFSQTIAAGSVVPRGTPVGYAVTSVLQPFDPSATVISQYANSPSLLALAFNMVDYLRPDVNFEQFFSYIWDIDTAQGFGLDIWGKIVGVSRLLHIPNDVPYFGFENSDDPPDWSPFGQGTFYTGTSNSQTYILPDGGYRILILTKALANIAATTAPSLNRLLQNLFPGRGKAYVVDLGNMAMRYVFEFSLSPVEFAILTQSGALPHPAGVSVDVQVVPTGGNFGFAEQGAGAQPFDQGVFA